MTPFRWGLLFVAVSVFLWLGLGAPLQAAPHVVSGPLDPATFFCGGKVDSSARTNTPVAVSGTVKTCKIDVGGVSVGQHTIDATAVPAVGDTTRTESPPSEPLTFVRPAPPGAPTGLAVVLVSGKPHVQSQAVVASVTVCGWVVDGAAKVDVSPVASKCDYDVSALAGGTHTLSVTAAWNDTLWGRLESAASAPFAYNVPTPLKVPSGLGLQP